MEKMLKLADNLSLPADEAVTQKYGFIGRSGSGKSYAAMRLAELFLGAGAQVIALDWVGIWWSLRLAADGKRPGFEHVYIFGGEHADVELRPESGAVMADLLIDKHISVVLDVMHFRKAERTRFATAFAEQFFHRKKTARTACHLFIEEAQAYLPQMVRGDEARMVGVFEDIGKVGRNYGIGNSLISQRPQAINKDVLNQIEVLLAFQTNGPQERKAIAGWTSENTTAGAAMIQALPTLRTGHALVWSPQWLRVSQEVHITKRDTYDASSTPATKAEKSAAPKRLAPTDLELLGAAIAATIEKVKQDDPRELRKRIAEQDRELAKLRNSSNRSEGLTTPKKVPVLTDADRAALLTLADRHTERMKQLGDATAAVAASLHAQVDRAIEEAGQRVEVLLLKGREAFARDVSTKGLSAILNKLDRVAVPPKHHEERPGPSRPLPAAMPGRASVATRPAPRQPSSGSGESMPPGEKAVLTAAAMYADGVTRDQLGVLTGYKRSTRDAYIVRLTAKGWIEPSSNGHVLASDAGLAALGSDFEPLPTGASLLGWWRDRLPDGERRVLDVLVAEYPNAVPRERVDEQTGFKRSTRDAYLVRLGARKLVESVGRGEVRANDALFGS